MIVIHPPVLLAHCIFHQRIAADGIHSTVRTSIVGEVNPQKTGLSAYRFMLPTEKIEQEVPEFCAKIKPREPFTSMVMAHDCRLIMGPAREGTMYSFVGLVPDVRMNENSDSGQSWVSKGDVNLMLETFKDYPEWIKSVFKLSTELGLWQLRDLDPLETWTKGRAILIGDAAHAMLPTQGQGASQAVEDAEALGAFFEGFGTEGRGKQQIEMILKQVYECRRGRATLIQKYSREAARPATLKDSKEVTM